MRICQRYFPALILIALSFFYACDLQAGVFGNEIGILRTGDPFNGEIAGRLEIHRAEANADGTESTGYISPVVLARLLKAKFEWDAKTERGTISFEDKKLFFAVGLRRIDVSGRIFSLDAEAGWRIGAPCVPLSILNEGVPYLIGEPVTLLDYQGQRIIEGYSEPRTPIPEPETPQAPVFIPTITPRPVTLRLVIDPGHGGVETGTRGPSGLLEKEIALDIAGRIKELAGKELNLEVFLTRESDEELTHDARKRFAVDKRADLFISIHSNPAFARPSTGVSVFIFGESSGVESEMLSILENQQLSGTESEPFVAAGKPATKEKNRRFGKSVLSSVCSVLNVRNPGVTEGSFNILDKIPCPAILIEVGYIDTAEIEAKFKDSAHLDKIAGAILEGVREYRKGRK